MAITIPLLLWVGGIQARGALIRPSCATPADAQLHCAAEAVNSLDRMGMGIHRGDADAWSNRGQIAAMIAAAGVPLLFQATRMVTPAGVAIAFAEDLAVLMQTIAWNGALTEAARVATARPRPFVYADPAGQGQDPAHYVSFYSGHTSFVATVMIALLLILIARGAGPGWVFATGISLQCVLMITALGRVLSDRHFVTDTLVATVAGGLVAIAVAWACRRPASGP